MNAISRLMTDKLTPEQEYWIRGLTTHQLKSIMMYMPGTTYCPPEMIEEIKKYFGEKWGKTARLFCQTEVQKRQNDELMPASRREEFVMPRGGAIEYGVNAVKISVPGMKTQEIVACPLPTTQPNPDPDIVRTAAVVAQFADIKKGQVVSPINSDAVAQYSGQEGFADGARVSTVPGIVADLITKSVVFSNDIKDKGTVTGEVFCDKIVRCLSLLPTDELYVLNWELITKVFRSCRASENGTLNFFVDNKGQRLYDKAAVAVPKKGLSDEDLKIWNQFKEALKYPPLKFGVIKNKVKAPESKDESFRRMVRGTAAAVGVSRGLGKIVANLDFCSGQSEQIRLACWYKAMVLSCGIPFSKIDVKCGPGVGQLLLSQLKDEVAEGLVLVIGDSKARHTNSAFRSERRPGSHVIFYMDGVMPSTPKEKKVDKDIEIYHNSLMESQLTEVRSLYTAGWTIGFPASHGYVFEVKGTYAYALKNNYNSHVILSSVKLSLNQPVVPAPYDLPEFGIYDRTLGSVIKEISSWAQFKEHTIKAMTNAMSYYINPTYSCTPLGRLFRLDGTVEFTLLEGELVYVGRAMAKSNQFSTEDTVLWFDDDEEMAHVLKEAGVSTRQNTTADTSSVITSVIVDNSVASEQDFEVIDD